MCFSFLFMQSCLAGLIVSCVLTGVGVSLFVCVLMVEETRTKSDIDLWKPPTLTKNSEAFLATSCRVKYLGGIVLYKNNTQKLASCLSIKLQQFLFCADDLK
jgi:hypothetical protein